MELRREFLLTIGTLIVLNLCLAFGAIGLLMRMGPAITHILAENVRSIVAAEELFAELTAAGDLPMNAEERARVQRLIIEAKNNVTRDEETTAIAALERHLPAAVNGDREAKRHAVAAIRELVHVNRDSMDRADHEARRLGRAGAWAAVFVGFISFLLGIFIILRLQRRFLRPLSELYEVLERSRQGDHLRRCNLSDAPREVIQVMESTNQLLDERLKHMRRTMGSTPPSSG